MRLTKHSDYALRVLVYVASAEGRQVSTEEVGAAFDISTHHLVKVVGKLGCYACTRCGLVEWYVKDPETLRDIDGKITITDSAPPPAPYR